VNEGLSNQISGILIQDPARSGHFNMAADSFAASWAKGIEAPILRLYTWNCATLSLGFHQKITEAVLRRCKEAGVPVVRRPTGGRAVLHDNELTYCLCLPIKQGPFAIARDELLRQIGEVFVMAARKCGLNADLAHLTGRNISDHEPLRKGSPLCFDSVSRWEVRLDGIKWIGSAQRLLPGVLLQHGSIIAGSGSKKLSELFGLKNQKDLTQDWADRQIDVDRLREAIPVAFSNYWNIDWHTQSFDETSTNEINTTADQYLLVEA